MINDNTDLKAALCRVLQDVKWLIRYLPAVIGLVLLTGQAVFAQSVVAPTCPQGYVLQGSNCVQGAPTPSCPSGYFLSGGRCIANQVRPSRPTSTVSPSDLDWDHLDCNDLWYERNRLFAQYGRCFTTKPGRNAFHNSRYPNVCQPPYGKLPAGAKVDVAAIQRVERRKGCR